MKPDRIYILHKIKKIARVAVAGFTLSLVCPSLSARAGAYSIEGVVTNETDTPLFASVAISELKTKTTTDEEGRFRLVVPGPGMYRVYVQSSGFQSATREVEVKEGSYQTQVHVTLKLGKLMGQTLHVTGSRDLQSLSRQTMTQEEIREVPATLGDSINALASFSGVDQFPMFGGLGPLIIRGADPFTNRYYIDGIPVHSIQHFLGLHSVVHNDLIDKIDLYSSMAPAMYGNFPLGGVININTVDDIKKSGTHIGVGMISSNISTGAPLASRSNDIEGGGNSRGYWIGAARYGYLTAILGPLLESATGDQAGLPEYYDYQLKGKIFLDKYRSLTTLFLGYGDAMERSVVSDADTRKKALEEGTTDPFLLDLETSLKVQTHIQSLWYTYRPSDIFSHTLKVFSSLNSLTRFQNIDNENAPSWIRNQRRKSTQNIFGAREELAFHSEFSHTRAGVDAMLYQYKTEGSVIIPKKQFNGAVWSGLTYTEDMFDVEYLSQNSRRWVYSGFLDQNFNFGSFTFEGGVRGDYFPYDDLTTVDPRGLVSWALPGDTVLSAGAGSYGSFIQTNFYWQSEAPQLIDATGLKAEKAIHRTVGIEKKFSALYGLKLEAFSNTYRDLFTPASGLVVNGKQTFGDNSGQREVYGAELTLKKEKSPVDRTLYGWLSYTYMEGRQRSGLPVAFDPLGSDWIQNENVRRHAVKAVAGYKLNANLIGARFRLLSSLPYTPIAGDDGDPFGIGRYDAVYGERYSRYLPLYHQLDLRFSREKSKSWGRIMWYIEIQNLYDQRMPIQLWKYNQPYRKDVNPVVDTESGPGILPTFGLEIYF